MRLAALALLAACTTFDPIERGVCGNGLVEPGEDCDSPDPSCVACAVACMTGSDCPNAAYTCGVDGLCHAPSGLLAQPTPQTLDLIDELQIADIDRDGIGDVVGVSTTSLDVHYGDPSASLATSVEIATPQQTGTVAFGDIDGDGVPDATIITEDGIVAFTSPYAALSAAVSFLPLTDGSGNELDVLATFPIDSLAFGLVVAGSDAAAIVIEQIGDGTTHDARRRTALVPIDDVATGDLDSYTVTQIDGSIDTVVVLYAHDSGPKMCVESFHLGAVVTGSGRSLDMLDITPTGTPPARRPAFAELDSATCPSLIAGEGSATLIDFVGSRSAGSPPHCVIAAASTVLGNAPNANDAVPIGHIPLTPGIATFASDLLVLQNGVYSYEASTLAEIYKSGPTLTAVSSGDIDGDGNVDAALISSGAADFQLLYRRIDIIPAFVGAPVQTDGAVGAVALADFDGNGTADVAYTEQLLDHTQLSVAFGFPGQEITQIVEGAFPAVLALTPIGIADSSDPESVIADLIVVDEIGSDASAVTLLHGSPERTMFSYFEPRTTSDPARETAMRQVVTGFFGGGSTEFPDVISMLPNSTSQPTFPPPPPVLAYRLDGSADGLVPGDPIDTVDGEGVTGIGDCNGTGARGSSAPCIRDATVLGWQTGSAHDVIVAVDHLTPPQAYKIDPWMFAPSGGKSGSAAATPLAMPTTLVTGNAIAHTAFPFDVDGDGAPELVLAFAPAETADAGGPGLVESCEMDQTGTPTSCTDLGALVVAAAPSVAMLTCVDAAAGNFAPAGPDLAPPTPTLLVLCHDPTGTSLLARVAGTTATIVATGLPPLRQIAVGDVTGDGVDDVVAIRGDSGDRALTVLVQCSSRDLACQVGAVAP